MTTYGYNGAMQTVISLITTGTGPQAADVVVLPDAATQHGPRLATVLTRLSDEIWRTYTHPPAAAGDDLRPNTEGWRRDLTSKKLGSLPQILAEPNLPTADGMLIVSYDPVEEAAHQVGRVLCDVSDTAVSAAISGEVLAEVDAVDSAAQGRLTGRAGQALSLTRAVSSPLQVEAAHAALADGPFGGGHLAEIEPAAACVAAAEWLHAAATIAGRCAGVGCSEVVAEADNIEALPVRSPTVVLEAMESGESATEIVHDLLAEAQAVADGRVYNAEQLRIRLEEPESYPGLRDDTLDALRIHIRACILDPRRPAQDLREDLELALHGCFLLWRDEDIADDLDDDAADETAVDIEDSAAERFWSEVSALRDARRL